MTLTNKKHKKTRQSAAAYNSCWEKQELSSAARTNNTVSRRKRVLSQLNQVGTRSAFLGVSRGRSTDSVKTVEKIVKKSSKNWNIDILCDDCSGTFTFRMRLSFASLILCQVWNKFKGKCTRTRLSMTRPCCILRQCIKLHKTQFSWVCLTNL